MSFWKRLFGDHASGIPRITPEQVAPLKQVSQKPLPQPLPTSMALTEPPKQPTNPVHSDMADLRIHCELPEAAKGLVPVQLDELIQAMSFCAWNAINSRLGDIISNRSAGSYGAAGIVFEMSATRSKGMVVGQEVQLLWVGLKQLVEREGVQSFLTEYHNGRYGKDPRLQS